MEYLSGESHIRDLAVRCSSLLCVNFTQIEFNPIDPSAGRAPESSPPDTRSPSSARGGALPRPSLGDKQAACAITDPAALSVRVQQHARVRETTWMLSCVLIRRSDPPRQRGAQVREEVGENARPGTTAAAACGPASPAK